MGGDNQRFLLRTTRVTELNDITARIAPNPPDSVGVVSTGTALVETDVTGTVAVVTAGTGVETLVTTGIVGAGVVGTAGV